MVVFTGVLLNMASDIGYILIIPLAGTISSMMSFFALIIVYFQKYEKKAGFGTIMANMLPYSIAFFIGWVLLLIVWILIGLPLGPEVSLYYNQG